MKREILLLISAAAFALAGCATDDGRGGTTSYTGSVYGTDTSDFGRGEVWRNTPGAQRSRGDMLGPVVEPGWDPFATGDYRH